MAVIDRSSARISGLIDDVLDFTRIRLGGGISLTVREDSQLEAMLDQVVSEMRTANPDRVINCDFELASAVPCDRDKVGQLFSNLLANALTHGDSMAPVGVRARSAAGKFELSVSNVGAPIDPETGTKLFQPFVRGTDPATSHGLGLGLTSHRKSRAPMTARLAFRRLQVRPHLRSSCRSERRLRVDESAARADRA